MVWTILTSGNVGIDKCLLETNTQFYIYMIGVACTLKYFYTHISYKLNKSIPQEQYVDEQTEWHWITKL